MKFLRVFFIVALFLASANCAKAENKVIKIHFIDVEEGESVLVQTPEGKNVLIDAGNLITGFNVVKYLESAGVKYLDHLIFTHPHPDHIGGAFFIAQMMDVGSVYDNGQPFDDTDILRWYSTLIRSKENYEKLRMGDTLTLDDVRLRVLWPPKSLLSQDLNWNVNSLVIMVEFGDFRCLLTGDLTSPGEEMLLSEKKDLKANLLKIGHHGYPDASSKEFLKAVNPEISVIFDKNNPIYGPPAKEVLERLGKIDTAIYQISKSGTIVVIADSEGSISVTDN